MQHLNKEVDTVIEAPSYGKLKVKLDNDNENLD